MHGIVVKPGLVGLAAGLLAGLVLLIIWLIGQRIGDRLSARWSLPAGGWWMGLALVLPGWVWLLALHRAGRPDLALGQLVGGQFYRLLVAMPLLMLAAPVAVERTGSRWLIMAAAIFPVLLLLVGFDGTVNIVDGQFLLTLTVLVFWVVTESDHEGLAPPTTDRLGRRRWPWGSAVGLLAIGLLGAGMVLLGLYSAGCIVRAVPAGWIDRPVSVSVLGIVSAWPAVPAALIMLRRWDAESAMRGLLLANVLSLGLALTGAAFVGQAVARSMPFSLPLWRVDVVLLVLLGMLPLPLMIRQSRFGRIEAVCLLACFLLYVAGTWRLTM
ncbi:MAG: hypothetical protein BIFFINMI_02651 [Phycisphaerae bacterium]|nr:hypothetical protein [Phycisphaerae bacterium]